MAPSDPRNARVTNQLDISYILHQTAGAVAPVRECTLQWQVELNYSPEGDDISTYPRVLFSLSLSTVFIAPNRSAVFTHTGGYL